MSSERLAALLRQRQLLAEHLGWLDAEIAAVSAAKHPETESAPTATVSPAPTPPPALPAVNLVKEADPEALARANALADSLLKDYSAKNPDTPESTRRSCLLLSVAFGLFCVAAVMAAYLLFYR